MLESADDVVELIRAGELEAHWRDVIALCAEDPAVREQLRPLRGELGDELDGEYWLSVMLGVLHEEPFVALEPGKRRGLTGRMSGIVDNFQLHVLLMDAFGLATTRAAAVALGDGPQQTEETITGAWNLYTHRAWPLPAADDLDAKDTWIWNEGTPADIPVLDGHRVILLGPPAYTRGWRSQRIFHGLAASLNARALEPGELKGWVARLG
jgi:hypothetical protein